MKRVFFSGPRLATVTGRRLLTSAGFTLVELMVVVAIIALLAATAIPQFRKYQAKSRVSEARLALAGAYTAEESYFAEYNHYYTCIGFMGYIPTGAATDRYFTVGFSTSMIAPLADTPTACTATSIAASFAYLGSKRPGGATALAIANLDGSGMVAGSAYTIEAVGIVDKDFTAAGSASATAAARLTISDTKTITQRTAGY